jgi:hypothetical protein
MVVVMQIWIASPQRPMHFHPDLPLVFVQSHFAMQRGQHASYYGIMI